MPILVFALSAFVVTFAVMDVADERAELRRVIAANSVDRTVDSRYCLAWYSDLCTVAERAAILERNIAAHLRLIELDPVDPAIHCDLGAVYAAVERWTDAKKELETALAAGDRLDRRRRATALYEMANCLWAEGDTDGAKKLVEELAAMKWNGTAPRVCAMASSLARVFSDQDADMDALKLPHSLDCRPFPAPQKAEYGDARVSLDKVELRVAIDAKGLAGPDDPVVRLLKRKLQRFGSKFEKGGASVAIEISPDAPVDRPQGYLLEVRGKQESGRKWYGTVSIRARTRLGATWGVVSLIQCIDRDGLSVRDMKIEDWPESPKRGVLAGFWSSDFLEFALFSKMSSVSMHLGQMEEGECWTYSPLDRERLRLCGEMYAGFGIALYAVTRHVSSKIPVQAGSYPRMWEHHLALARLLAGDGIGNSFQVDGGRRQPRTIDIKEPETGARRTADYLTHLYREVKSEYPGFQMQFCTDSCGGVDTAGCSPESYELCLKSLGEHLDRDIEVLWTGSDGNCECVTSDMADKCAELVGRKPTMLHGNRGARRNSIQYGANPAEFTTGYSPDILRHLESFLCPMVNYFQMPEVCSAMDWCWNPVAHVPESALCRSVEQAEGAGVFEILAAATPGLAYFDKFIADNLGVGFFDENSVDLDRRVEDAEIAWKKVLSIARNGGRFVRGFKMAIERARKLSNIRRDYHGCALPIPSRNRYVVML